MEPSAQGLTEAEARRRLSEFGPNEMPYSGRRSLGAIALETMREAMFLLLVGAAVLYLVLGDLGEGLFLVAGAFATVGLVIAQEARSERALAALRELAQPQARVIRDGAEGRIPARELVPGDLLLIGEGERMPADGRLVGGDVLSVDESALTGESAPVTKQPSAASSTKAAEARPGAEGGPDLFGGTLVVRGQGVVEVGATGTRSALGQIGAALAAIGHEPTPMQQTAGRLVGLLGALALVFCGVVAVAYGLLRGNWIEGVLAGVTVAIALIPEEFPMVLAVFLALGAWRLARHQVLVRRSAVIETLGGASVLCVDKTGTLTENHMRVARLWTSTGDLILDGDTPTGASAELLRVAALASAVRPVDPMDKAVRALSAASDLGSDIEGEPRRAWPLRPERLAVVQLWRERDGAYVAAAKGAPEAIFRLCRMSPAQTDRLHEVIHEYAAAGLRVLGVASARGDGEFLQDPADVHFDFSGLVGFIDPLRADVPAALAEARGAGIKVVMITGDHPATALAIARAAGLETEAGALTGADLEALSLEALRERLRRVTVFARIVPDQKLRLVEALKAEGEVVAMTGDGVNDAPALEAAHIGIAMGRKGADVAREAADLILLDDSFASIVGGVRLGRRIFRNLRRALTYVTAIHVPIAGLALAPILMGLPPLLFPMHVVLLELVIDPTCSLVFEAEPSESAAMRRPPRRRDEALFGPRQIVLALAQGAGILAGVLALYAWALQSGVGEGAARGAAFVALVFGNLTLALADSASSGRLFAPHRRTYWLIVAAVTTVMTAILGLPPLSELFDLVRPSGGLLALAVAVALLTGGWPAALRVFAPPRPPQPRV
jgi:Ca2+-transporting ATPase